MRTKETMRAVAAFLALLVLLFFSGCSNDEKDKEIAYQKAMVYLKESKEKEAIIELRNAIQIDPKYVEARYQLGLLYLKMGEFRQAFEELQRVATLDPKNFDAKIKTAEFYLLSNKKDDARIYVTDVLGQAPDNADALALLASLERLDKKYDKALSAVNKALSASPKEDRFYVLKGQVLMGKEDYAGAEQAFSKALEINGGKMANYTVLTDFYIERNQMDKANALLDKMAAAFPNSSQPLLQKASLQLRQSDIEGAGKYLQKALSVDPSNSDLKASVAEFYSKQGKYLEAEELYKDAIRTAKDPTNIEAQQANFYFEHNQFDLAKDTMDKVLAKNTKNAGATLVKAKFALKNGKSQEALDISTGLIRDYPQWGEAFFVKALAHSTLREQNLAKEAIVQSIKFSPGSSKAHTLLALILMQEGNLDDAKRESYLALRINSHNQQAALTFARSVYLSKDYDGAEKLFTELHEKLPDNVEVMGTLGMIYLAQKQEAKAKASFEQLLKVQPQNAQAVSFLVKIAEKNGASNASLIKMTQERINRAPESGELHILLANLYLHGNMLDKALEGYQKAQKLSPDNPVGYTMAAVVLMRQDKTDQAIATFIALIEKQPKAIGAYMGLAAIYEQTGRATLAQDAYRKLLTISPDFAPAANNLAWLIAESSNPDLGEALRLAMLARQQRPDDASIIDTLGWVHYKRGAFSLAKSEFQVALQRDDNMPVIRYHLALALYGDGNREEAIAELEKALKMPQPFPGKDKATVLLQQWKTE